MEISALSVFILCPYQSTHRTAEDPLLFNISMGGEGGIELTPILLGFNRSNTS